jgi:hypothetical protein
MDHDTRSILTCPWPRATIVFASLVSLAFMLGLFDLPHPPTAAQIAAAQTYLDGVCPSCPVYEKLQETAALP